MKTVRYDYTLKELAGMIAQAENVPDGWWDLAITFEQLASTLPALSGQQDPNPYPGAMARVLGVTLVPCEVPPTPQWYPHAVEVRGGKVIMERDYGIDTDNSRHEQSSDSPRGNIRLVK